MSSSPSALPWTFVPAAASAGDLGGCTLVIPALGTADVCRLAIDAILSSLYRQGAGEDRVVKNLGRLSSPALKASVCFNPLGLELQSEEEEHGFTGAAEVYAIPSAKLAFLQLRSTPHEGMAELFVQHVFEFALSQKVAKVVVLSGVSSAFCPELLLAMPPSRRLAAFHVSASGAAGLFADEGSAAAAATEEEAKWAASGAAPLFKVLAKETVEAAKKAVSSGASSSGGSCSAGTGLSPSEIIFFGAATGAPERADVDEEQDDGAGSKKKGEAAADWKPVKSAAAIAATRALFGGSFYGSGLVPSLFRRALDSKDGENSSPLAKSPESVVFLVSFASEGDSLATAVELAAAAARYLGLSAHFAPAPKQKKRKEAKEGGGNAAQPLVALSADGGESSLCFLLPPFWRELSGAPIDFSSGLYGF